jgi:hypothetical protein
MEVFAGIPILGTQHGLWHLRQGAFHLSPESYAERVVAAKILDDSGRVVIRGTIPEIVKETVFASRIENFLLFSAGEGWLGFTHAAIEACCLPCAGTGFYL